MFEFQYLGISYEVFPFSEGVFLQFDDGLIPLLCTSVIK